MARLGVVGAVPADAGQRLIGRYLAQQLRQHRRVSHAVVGDLDGPNLQRVPVNAQMHLAPLPSVLGPVFLALPFAFAQELDARAVYQQVQCRGAGPVGQLHPQALLAPAHGAEVRHLPVQVRHAQQAVHQAQALVQGQAEQAFDAHAELDGGIGEHPLAIALAAGRGVPPHALVQADGQRSSGLELGVVLGPVGGLVAALGALGFSHARRLSGPRRGLCNKAHANYYSKFFIRQTPNQLKY